MVGITFPSKLTEEEENFQKKLVKLKKKKKAIAAAKIPKLEKQESITETPQLSTEVCPVDEQAKKLKKLAAIKEALASKDKTFKRTKRRRDSEAKTSVAFHPFSENENQEQQRSLCDPHQKFESESPASSRNNETVDINRHQNRSGAPKCGRTLYVRGQGLTEAVVRKTFQIFGSISNITLEFEKNCAFVTYNNSESADEAIKEVNNSMVENILLEVSFARKQPNMDTASGDTNTNSNWSSIAANSSQKSSYKDRRNLVSYDDDLFGPE